MPKNVFAFRDLSCGVLIKILYIKEIKNKSKNKTKQKKCPKHFCMPLFSWKEKNKIGVGKNAEKSKRKKQKRKRNNHFHFFSPPHKKEIKNFSGAWRKVEW